VGTSNFFCFFFSQVPYVLVASDPVSDDEVPIPCLHVPKPWRRPAHAVAASLAESDDEVPTLLCSHEHIQGKIGQLNSATQTRKHRCCLHSLYEPEPACIDRLTAQHYCTQRDARKFLGLHCSGRKHCSEDKVNKVQYLLSDQSSRGRLDCC
jgi:hypothetical protein